MNARGLGAVVCLLAVWVAAGFPAARAGPASPDPGVTASSIVLGGTVPLSGPESAYGPVGRGAEAYFKYVNARGGVLGRKIVYRLIDDAYDPARTVQATRQLVLQDKVFAIFNSVGTEHVLAVRPFLNSLKVPHLFVGSGAGALAQGRKRYPWTMGFLPSFAGEGAVYGRYIAKSRPSARIAVLYENSEYGEELIGGLRRGLGARARQIVATQTYEVTDTDVASQVARLKASRATIFMIFALPKQALQAFVSAHRLGWRPLPFVTSVSIDPFVMRVARLNTGGRATEGAIGMAFLKDPTDPRLAKDPGVALYKTVLRRHLPGADPSVVAHMYGMAVAHTMVEAIRRAGKNLTRQALLRAATHLNQRTNPFLRKGISVRTSPSDYYPLAQVQLLRYRTDRWRPFGPLVTVKP